MLALYALDFLGKFPHSVGNAGNTSTGKALMVTSIFTHLDCRPAVRNVRLCGGKIPNALPTLGVAQVIMEQWEISQEV